MRLRKIIWAYQDFMRRRKLAKTCPEAIRLAALRKAASKAHRPTRHIERRHQEIMTGLLEG